MQSIDKFDIQLILRIVSGNPQYEKSIVDENGCCNQNYLHAFFVSKRVIHNNGQLSISFYVFCTPTFTGAIKKA